MASKSAYQKLSNEEESEEEQPIQSSSTQAEVVEFSTSSVSVNIPLDDAPPPYEPGEDTHVNVPSFPSEDLLNQSPPLYSDIVKLPTYNESENIESDSEERAGLNRMYYYFVSGDSNQSEISEENLGTDIGFILCFLLSFLFNGLGFIVAYCSTSTLSSHYGAVSGFGLSLVKWAFIAKHKLMFKGYFQGNEWLLYCIILLGWMIFLRGMFAYAQIKRYANSRLTRQNEAALE